MSKADEALVWSTGVLPTTNNRIVSIGSEMAEQYRKPQAPPGPTQLTPLQKEMIERGKDLS